MNSFTQDCEFSKFRNVLGSLFKNMIDSNELCSCLQYKKRNF